MPDDLEETIRDNAQGPAKAAGDAGSVEQYSPPDQIAADRYLKSQQGRWRAKVDWGCEPIHSLHDVSPLR